MSSGLKAAGAGILAGGAALVTMPLAGAKEDGVTGFFTGLVEGAVGAVGLTVGGAVVGATQVVRGVVTTPDAISQAQQGKKWDTTTGTWILDSTNLRDESLLAG